MIAKKKYLLILIPCLFLIPALILTKKKSNSSCLTTSPQAQPTNPVKTDVPALKDEISKTNTRTVTIKSSINHDMLGYKHWGIWYHPSTFTLSINGTPFQHEQEHTVTVENNKLLITYHYEFLNGVRSGGRTLEFEIPANVSTLTMSFDWKNKQHVLFNNAQWLGEIDEKPAKNTKKVA